MDRHFVLQIVFIIEYKVKKEGENLRQGLVGILNAIGKLNIDSIAFPFNFAGFHLGIDLTNRKASTSHSGQSGMPRIILGATTFPVSGTTNCT